LVKTAHARGIDPTATYEGFTGGGISNTNQVK